MTFYYTSLFLFLLFVLWLATLPTAPGSPEKKKNTSLFVTVQHSERVEATGMATETKSRSASKFKGRHTRRD